MAFKYFHHWVTRVRQKLSRLEQRLILNSTKGPKDPERLKYLTDALRPQLCKRVSLSTSIVPIKTFAPDIVHSVAIVCAINNSLRQGNNIQSFFYEVKCQDMEAFRHLQNSKGHFVDVTETITLLKEELEKLSKFYSTTNLNETTTATMNKRYLLQNMDIFHDYVNSLISAINQTTVYANTL